MPKYRKKPVEVDAFRFMIDEVMPDWFTEEMNQTAVLTNEDGTCIIVTLEGEMRADYGDYIIRGVQGEIYPCKPDIFEATYDKV